MQNIRWTASPEHHADGLARMPRPSMDTSQPADVNAAAGTGLLNFEVVVPRLQSSIIVLAFAGLWVQRAFWLLQLAVFAVGHHLLLTHFCL